MIVVVVCGSGCSGGCWFLVDGDCHWAVHVSIYYSKYIILMCCIYYFNVQNERIEHVMNDVL